jgi:hypothetical protein
VTTGTLLRCSLSEVIVCVAGPSLITEPTFSLLGEE